MSYIRRAHTPHKVRQIAQNSSASLQVGLYCILCTSVYICSCLYGNKCLSATMASVHAPGAGVAKTEKGKDKTLSLSAFCLFSVANVI